MKPKATPTWNRIFLEVSWNYSICFESKESTQSTLQFRLYKLDGSSSQLVGIKNISLQSWQWRAELMCVQTIYNRQCLTRHLVPGASSVFTQQLPPTGTLQGLCRDLGCTGEPLPCWQGPGTHLQPRNNQCIQNQLTTSMMREMGKLNRNQVPKLTTSAAGYWL